MMEPRDREGEAARGSVRQAGPRAVTTDFDPRTLIPVFSCPAARYIPPPIRVTAPRQPFKPRHLRLFRSACRPGAGRGEQVDEHQQARDDGADQCPGTPGVIHGGGGVSGQW